MTYVTFCLQWKYLKISYRFWPFIVVRTTLLTWRLSVLSYLRFSLSPWRHAFSVTTINCQVKDGVTSINYQMEKVSFFSLELNVFFFTNGIRLPLLLTNENLIKSNLLSSVHLSWKEISQIKVNANKHKDIVALTWCRIHSWYKKIENRRTKERTKQQKQ